MFQISFLAAFRLAGFFGVAVSWCSLCQAQSDGIDRSITLENVHHTYVVQQDGTFRLTVESVIHIDEKRAIKTKAQQGLSYNRSLETLKVTEAFTQKPDGRKVMVDAGQIKEQQERSSSQAPMFQDSVNKVVIFPEVSVGDRLVLRYERNRFKPLFPGVFEDITVPDFNPIQNFTLTYDLPAAMSLQSDARGFELSASNPTHGRRSYQWRYVPAERARIEPGAVSYLDYGHYLAVSTLTDFKDLAQAYQSRAQVEVTPAITELAAKLTANALTEREKALTLSDWVRQNIRYVAVYVGAGGVVPHPAQTVLDNRYGDCKDHVALLEALLKSVGISSSPALMNLGNAYAFPKVPTLGVLNHVMTYIPSMDLYLDSTDASIAAGYLPVNGLSKQVLLSATGEIKRTPDTQPSEVSSELVFKVKASGAADFSNVTTIKGWASEFSRHTLESMKPADRDLLVQQVLAWYGQRGSGSFKTTSMQADAGFKSTVDGSTENLINLPGPVGVQTFSSLAGGIAQNVYSLAQEKERSQSFVCLSGAISELSRFELPSGIQVIAIPKALEVRQKDMEYTARYEKQGDTIVIKRRFLFSHPSTVCTPEDFTALKPAIEKMVKDLQSQIIVQAS